MDYLGDKLNSITGEALSGINEYKRKRKQAKEQKLSTKRETNQPESMQPEISVAEQPTTTSSNIPSNLIYGFRSTTTEQQQNTYPKLTSVAFGGDSYGVQLRPPPIGFRVDLLQPVGIQYSRDTNDANTNDDQNKQQQQPPSGPPIRSSGSELSLYEGDAWSRAWFQRVMILSLIRLLIFIRKVYEDFQATKQYNLAGATGHFLVAAATLFLPTLIFTIYRVSRYLQIVLPSYRASLTYPYPAASASEGPSTRKLQDHERIRGDEDTQIKQSLMGSHSTSGGGGSRTSSPNKQQVGGEEDGLVTARQSPSNLLSEEFHDSKSQQGITQLSGSSNSPDFAISPAPSTAIVKDLPEQVGERISKEEKINIDAKLGSLPVKQGTKIVIGASEQLLHGVLYIFWQLKRQVDVMGYLVERSCLWRKPKDEEKEELGRLRTGSDGLEWFQDFYAAFLAILSQVYTLGLHWAAADSSSIKLTSGLTPAVNSGLNSVSSPDSEISISQSARAISETLRQQSLAGNTLDSKDLLIMSELVVSSAVIISLLVAVGRRDDGPLTVVLSMLGWGSIFASRIIIISLAFVHIGWRIMLPLVFCHILGITGWIYKIAIDSHNNKPDESEESRWEDIELAEGGANVSESGTTEQERNQQVETTKQLTDDDSMITSQWSIVEHLVLISQIFILFAIPSLFFWPIMFNLKLHYRPFKYLVLILSENFILIPVIWFIISSSATQGQWILLCAVGGFSIFGFIFVSLYICCKPSLTEYFARADELFNEAERSGIYFEFCSRVFKMPDLSKQTFRRLMKQSEQLEEIEIDVENENEETIRD